MNDLQSRAIELQQLSHDLMYLGMDGQPVYSDDFCRLNKEILIKSDSLFSAVSAHAEEEAHLCLALLMGYNATIYDNGDKIRKKETVLARISDLLSSLPDSLLKVRLLTYTYSEVYEEELCRQAHTIIDSWDNTCLTAEQREIIAELQNIEENPYPWEYVD